jgi:hypothetical protein
MTDIGRYDRKVCCCLSRKLLGIRKSKHAQMILDNNTKLFVLDSVSQVRAKSCAKAIPKGCLKRFLCASNHVYYLLQARHNMIDMIQ